jgi:hypothetical protein
MILARGVVALGFTLLAGVPAPPPVRHDVHVTLTRMAVDSSTVVARIRCFKDDLQLGLARFYKLPKVELAAGARADSLFGGYLAERMWVEADGVRLAGSVQASGAEVDEQGQPMMWFVVEYPTRGRPRTLGVRNDLLFDTFPSQQNIVNVLNVQDEKRYSFYFVPGSDKVQQVSLRCIRSPA